MKKAFLAILSVFCLTVGQSTAQNAFGLNTAVKTQKTVQVGDNTYQVEVTKTGSEFIRCISTNKNEYAVWIGQETGETVGGEPVRVSKNGKLFILAISKNGNPYAKYIKSDINYAKE